MKLAIMQPYCFPYIGYWQLIANCDEFIFFDEVQYNKKSWMNRNRILHPDKIKDFQYISIPIAKHEKGTLIKDVIINNNENWKSKLLGQMTFYKKLKAPFYDETISLITEVCNQENKRFLSFAISSVKAICDYLDLNIKYRISSEIEFNRTEVKGPGEWALEISKALGANEYINPPGGYEIFDEEKYALSNVKLKFLKSNLSPYRQSWRESFTEGLSIIDVMMFCSKDEINQLLLTDFKLLTKENLING